jgi:hypothetical protein
MRIKSSHMSVEVEVLLISLGFTAVVLNVVKSWIEKRFIIQVNYMVSATKLSYLKMLIT